MKQTKFIVFSQIDDGEEGGEPAEDTELDEVVLDERLRGTATQSEDNHVLQIAQQTGQYPTRGEIDIPGTHPFNDFRRHGVHDIADHRHRGDNGRGLIDEGLVVTRNADAGLDTRLLEDAVVVVALRECQEECHEEGHHHQPVGYPDIDGHATCQYPHHKADGDDRHIEDGDLLEFDAIEDVHQPVATYYYI